MAEKVHQTVEVGVEVKLDPESVKRLLDTLGQVHDILVEWAQAYQVMLQKIADVVEPLAVQDQSLIIATRSAAHLEGSTQGATGGVAEETQRSIYDELDGQ